MLVGLGSKKLICASSHMAWYSAAEDPALGRIHTACRRSEGCAASSGAVA